MIYLSVTVRWSARLNMANSFVYLFQFHQRLNLHEAWLHIFNCCCRGHRSTPVSGRLHLLLGLRYCFMRSSFVEHRMVSSSDAGFSFLDSCRPSGDLLCQFVVLCASDVGEPRCHLHRYISAMSITSAFTAAGKAGMWLLPCMLLSYSACRPYSWQCHPACTQRIDTCEPFPVQRYCQLGHTT